MVIQYLGISMNIFNKQIFHKTIKGKNSKFFYCTCKRRYHTREKLRTHMDSFRKVG